MERFIDYIGKNYQKIQKKLQSYKGYDEDVFHNTIIKCSEIVDDIHLKFETDNDIIRYFIGAYKMNLLRQKLYYYEKYVTHPDELADDSPYGNNIIYQIDINIIIDDIKNKFGELLKDIYIEYLLDSISIADLQKKYKIKNLKQKFKDIKTYIHNTYTDRTSDPGY